VLVPEAIAVGSSLERVLDVAVGMTVLQGGSDRNGGGAHQRAEATGESGAEVKRGSVVTRGGGMNRGCSRDAHVWDMDGWLTCDGGDQRCTITITSPCAVSCVRALVTDVSRLSGGSG
jgi:hypothetical protein